MGVVNGSSAARRGARPGDPTLATDRTTVDLAELGRTPTIAETNVALVDGFQIAYVAAAGLLALGAVLLTVMLRRRHLAVIDVEEPVAVPA